MIKFNISVNSHLKVRNQTYIKRKTFEPIEYSLEFCTFLGVFERNVFSFVSLMFMKNKNQHHMANVVNASHSSIQVWGSGPHDTLDSNPPSQLNWDTNRAAS